METKDFFLRNLERTQNAILLLFNIKNHEDKEKIIAIESGLLSLFDIRLDNLKLYDEIELKSYFSRLESKDLYIILNLLSLHNSITKNNNLSEILKELNMILSQKSPTTINFINL